MSTILVPIRYPLNARSTQTLAAAAEFAREETDANLLVLHVNLFQFGQRVTEAVVRQAVAPLLSDVGFSVSIRRGFLVEEVILDEAIDRDVDCIVVGAKRRPRWRRLVTRVLRSQPEIGPFLRANVDPDVDVRTV